MPAKKEKFKIYKMSLGIRKSLYIEVFFAFDRYS